MVLTAAQTPIVRRRVRLARPDRLSRDYVAQRRGSLLHQRFSRLEAEEDRVDAARADRILSDPTSEYFDFRTGERVPLDVLLQP